MLRAGESLFYMFLFSFNNTFWKLFCICSSRFLLTVAQDLCVSVTVLCIQVASNILQCQALRHEKTCPYFHIVRHISSISETDESGDKHICSSIDITKFSSIRLCQFAFPSAVYKTICFPTVSPMEMFHDFQFLTSLMSEKWYLREDLLCIFCYYE